MSREDEKLFGAMRLFEALSGVDEELLAKADETVGRKNGVLSFSGKKARLSAKMAASLAAAASLLVVVGALWTGAPMFDSEKSAETAVLTVERTAADIDEGVLDEAVEEVEEEKEAVTEEKTGSSGFDNGDNTSTVTEAQKNIGQGNAGDSAKQEAFEKKEEGTYGDYRTECAENNELAVVGQMEDFSDAIESDERKVLTEAQARAVEGLGAYIPDTLPKGYSWETAKAAVNDETGVYESIFVCWTKGMDSIMITVSEESVMNITLTDITKKETYDVSLYDIPYAETVPEEYWSCFQDPVFTRADLSLEVVKSRMKAVSDAGDTDTPRGNFAIYYPEGVLLRFNGDGSAEEIWEMLR